MIYIIRVYENNDVYEYEYGNIEHAISHMKWEKLPCKLYEYKNGKEKLIDSKN